MREWMDRLGRPRLRRSAVGWRVDCGMLRRVASSATSSPAIQAVTFRSSKCDQKKAKRGIPNSELDQVSAQKAARGKACFSERDSRDFEPNTGLSREAGPLGLAADLVNDFGPRGQSLVLTLTNSVFLLRSNLPLSVTSITEIPL
ncbi:unnamed protein product [Calypogeia fissa]